MTKVTKVTVPPDHKCKELEDQIKLKDRQIQNLNNKIENLIREHKSECEKFKSEQENRESKLIKRTNDLREENIALQLQYEKQQSLFDVLSVNTEDLKVQYENRLTEKDKMITNLTDRIQNFLYDAKGEPWCKVGSVQNPGHTVEMQQPTLGNSQSEETFTKEDISNSGHIDSLSTEIQPTVKKR